jgi:multicomponent Na+:H+ antiporter subunit G
MSWLIGGLLIAGTFLMFLTGLGLLRMPDIFCRMHAATKGASLGVALLLLAAALFFQETAVVTKALVTVAFIFLTAPVAASLLGRAAYAQRTQLWEHSVIDEGRDKIVVHTAPEPNQTPQSS